MYMLYMGISKAKFGLAAPPRNLLWLHHPS